MTSTLSKQTSLIFLLTGVILLSGLRGPAQTLDLTKLYRPFNPSAPDQNYYGLVDLDQFPVLSYGYCKWGNRMESIIFPPLICPSLGLQRDHLTITVRTYSFLDTKTNWI